MHKLEIPLSSIEGITYDHDGYGNINAMIIELNGEYKYTTDVVVTKAVVDRDYIKKSDLAEAFRKRAKEYSALSTEHGKSQSYSLALGCRQKATELSALASYVSAYGRLPNDL